VNKLERMKAVIEGKQPDRVPVSFWRHFFVEERRPENLSKALVDFHQRHDWDFLKINARSSYHVEDWGVKVEFSDDPHTKPTLSGFPIQQVDDWLKLEPRDVQRGAYGEHLDLARRVVDALDGEAPVIMTIFSPISSAGKLVENDQLLIEHLRTDPEKVRAGLRTLTQTAADFVRAVMGTGVAGVFYATTLWATTLRMDRDLYADLVRPTDIEVLSAATRGWLNVLHVCQSQNVLLDLLDYPAAVLHWDSSDPSNPSLAQVRNRTQAPLIGGISDEALAEGDRDRLGAEIARARKSAGDAFILGAGCAIDTRMSEETLALVKKLAAD